MYLSDLKNKIGRDKPLHFHHMPADEQALMDDLYKNFDFKPITRKLRAKALLGLAVCGTENALRGHLTSYSARKEWYSGRSKFYGGDHFTYCHIIGALKQVEHTDMFIDQRIKPGSHNTEQSVLTASQKLIDIVGKIPVVHLPRPTVMVRDAEGRPIEIEDTAYSFQRRRHLDELNEWYETDVNVSFDPVFKQHGSFYKIGTEWIECRNVRLNSIYNRSSWDCGGRIYSWTTALSKERIRPKIMLNSEKTVVLDYKQFHPTMLFAMCGKQINRDILTS